MPHWLEDQNEDLRTLFAYIEMHNRGTQGAIGFELHVVGGGQPPRAVLHARYPIVEFRVGSYTGCDPL